MQSTEGQRDGGIVIVVIASILFTISYLASQFPSHIKDIAFGDKSFGPVIVGITGNTDAKGIFYVPEKANVHDLLGAAGVGNTEPFDGKMLNRPVSTGEVVVIDSRGRLVIEQISNANKLALGIPIDINKVTVDDLMLINGIGEKTAWRVVQFREKSGGFKRVEDLMKIPGIKDRKFQKFKGYFRTETVPPEKKQ
jgi:competence protein ComEA